MISELYHGSQLAVLMLHGVPKNIFFAHVHSRKYLNKNLSHLGPRPKAGSLAPISSPPPQRSLCTVRRRLRTSAGLQSDTNPARQFIAFSTPWAHSREQKTQKELEDSLVTRDALGEALSTSYIAA